MSEYVNLSGTTDRSDTAGTAWSGDASLVVMPEPWMKDARCTETDPDLFFPEQGGDAADRVRNAKKVCASCTVSKDCLAYALEHNERSGIWGGLTERERRGLQSDGSAA